MNPEKYLPDLLKNSSYQEIVNGRYYPEYELWIWNELLNLETNGAFNEQQLKALIEIAIVLGKLYKKQIGKKFWPENITIDQIKDAYENNSGLASHFGHVVFENGEFKNLGYISVFPDEVNELIKIIDNILEQKIFKDFHKDYLENFKKALQIPEIKTRRPDEWKKLDEMIAACREMNFFILHPLEDYIDEVANQNHDLVFSNNDNPWKYSFDFHLHSENDVMNKDLLKEIRKIVFEKYPGVINSSDNLMFADECIISGMNAKQPNRGHSVPNDVDVRKDKGKQIIMYTNNIDYWARNRYWEIFQNAIESFKPIESIVERKSAEDHFALAANLHVVTHELSHNVVRLSSIWLEEMKATVLGLDVMESMEKIFIQLGITVGDVYRCMVSECIARYQDREDTFAYHYYIGECMLLNAFVHTGGVDIRDDGVVMIDTKKCQDAVKTLTKELLDIYKHIEDKDIDKKVEDFKKKWFKEETYKSILMYRS